MRNIIDQFEDITVSFEAYNRNTGTGQFIAEYAGFTDGKKEIRLEIFEKGSFEMELRGEKRPLGINWSAYGTQSIEDAKIFAWFLDYVCKKMEKSNKQ